MILKHPKNQPTNHSTREMMNSDVKKEEVNTMQCDMETTHCWGSTSSYLPEYIGLATKNYSWCYHYILKAVK